MRLYIVQVGYGRKGAESDRNPVSIDLTSDDEDDTKTKINDVERELLPDLFVRLTDKKELKYQKN